MNEVEKLYRKLNQRNHEFKEEDTCYLFTTENIKGYLPNLENQDVLTVTSSGDHYFNMLLSGAKNIDLFDINSLSINILKLKKAAIENLDLDEFYTFFDIRSFYFFDFNIFLKLRDSLDEQTKNYFDYIYKLAKYDGNNIYYTNLLYHSSYPIDKLDKVNNYLEEQNYIKLKKILKEIKNINFIRSDIKNLKEKLNKQYDSIFFSNIIEYADDNFIEIVKSLNNNLNEYGNIYFGYLYNYLVNPKNKFYSQMIKSNRNMYSINITGTDEIFTGICYKDKVLVYSKE